MTKHEGLKKPEVRMTNGTRAWVIRASFVIRDSSLAFLTRLRCGAPPRPNPRRVAPKTFQVVMLAHIVAHDVDYDIEIIEHQPGCLQIAIDRARTEMMLIAQFIQNLIRNGPEMWLTVARG